MKVPLIDLAVQYRALKPEIDKSLIDLMEQSSFIRGPKVDQFEAEFAAYHGASACISLNSGTDALLLIFKALGVKPGDEIITVPYTFVATAEAIKHAGASLKFVDVDPNRYTLDPSLLEEAISPKTVGIVPVHLYGTPADMDPILEIARKHKLWVVEDACQAHGALYKGKKVGTFGAASAFSFYPSKNLGAYGDAGAVITNDAALGEEIRMLRDHGQKTKYRSEMLGYNSRMDAFQAAVLLVKLRHLDTWNASRRTIASWYRKFLYGIPKIFLPEIFTDSKEVYHLFVIRAPGARDALAAHLQAAGISTAVHYVASLHQQAPFHGNGKALSFPVSERLCTEVLSLPMFPDLTEEQAGYVAGKIKEFFL